MKTSVCAVAAALLVGACSSGNAASPPHGSLPPGTAALTVGGRDVGTTYSVRCESIDSLTLIDVDLRASGLSAMVSRIGALDTEFVRLAGVDGFTGSYERGRQGEATVTMSGPTYRITGAALGFAKSEPTRPKAATFTLEVSC